MRLRFAIMKMLVVAGAALAIIAPGAVASAEPPPPPGATPVTVTAGATTNVDVTLQHGTGSISGQLLDAQTNASIGGEPVFAFDRNRTLFGEWTTGSDGRFTLAGVGPAPDGVYICTDVLWDEEYPDTTDYADRCFPHAYWSPAQGIPAGARAVAVADGEQADVGTMHLARGGAIAGRLRTIYGNNLGYANVVVRSLSDKSLQFDIMSDYGSGTGARSGKYTIAALPPSPAGWAVCFKGGLVPKNGPNPFGYLDACYRGRPWRGRALPAHVTPVKVQPGQTTSKINSTVQLGGQLRGTVADGRGKPINYATVEIHDRQGHLLASGFTQHGRYKVGGLQRVHDVKVCVQKGRAYPRRCRNKHVTTRPHTIAKGPNLVLHKVAHFGASIGGTVTKVSSGKKVVHAVISVFDKHGAEVGYGGFTHERGRYNVHGLVGGKRYLVCVSAPRAWNDESPPAPACYRSAAWDGVNQDLPTDAHRVMVRRHRTVDFSLSPGGRITGTVTAADTGDRLNTVVDLYASTGHLLGSNPVDDGTYTFAGLAPGTYTLCFYGKGAGPDPNGPYLGQCYSDAYWPH
jgi:hypothetical protein